ncbi:MAG: hypothetical protein IT363_02240 [Methanoregulaceae archaeon]|nr:hypothetical protein [Methanoregulaceae archaeon]
MLALLAYTSVLGTSILPNEEIALEKLQSIWRAATGGTTREPFVVTNRWSSGDGKSGQLTFSNSDTLSYHFADTRIYSGQFAREKDTAHMPVLHESILNERALAVVTLLVPSRFTFRAEAQGYAEDRSDYRLSWSFMVDGHPTHWNPVDLHIDARTSKPIRLRAPSFPWTTDPALKPRFSEEHCYQTAWAKYLEVKPISVAAEVRYGARWVSPKLEQDPETLARATIPYAYWASDKYRVHLAEQRAVLAYSFRFGWQNVLVDAVTGEAMLVWGIDLRDSGRSVGERTLTDPVPGKTWHLIKEPKVTGSLRVSMSRATRSVATKMIALRSDQLTLVGQYDPASKLLWVDHSAGAKCYEVTGELARVLAKD